MPSFIQKNCTSCGDCEKVCPTKSIFKGVIQFVIDTDTCEDCALCAPVCPVNAIQLQPRPVAAAQAQVEAANKEEEETKNRL
jgi:ferredoxin